MKDRPYDKVIIGERIKKARELCGLTQDAVANMIDVNTAHVSAIENGRTGVSLGTIIALCDALDVTSDYLLFGEKTSHSGSFDKLFAGLNDDDIVFIEDFFMAYKKRLKV